MSHSKENSFQSKQNREAMVAERGIVEAFTRGMLSDKQAMQLLGIEDVQQLKAKKQQFGLGEQTEEIHDGSIIDGFVNYWESTNAELD